MSTEKWICSCGAENTGKYCANCGKARPEGNIAPQRVAKDGMQQASVNPAMMQGGGMPTYPPEPRKKHTTQILIGVIITLVAVIIGVFAFFHGADSRYLAKCQDAETIAADTKGLMQEVDGLSGNPDGDDAKDFLDRLDKAEGNLDQITGELKSMHKSSEYQDKNKKLVEVLLLEKNVLDNTESVIKDPTGKDSKQLVEQVKDQVNEINDRTDSLTIGAADFHSACDLSGLDQSLGKYIQKKEAADAAKKAEEERKAREAAAAKQAAFQKNLQERNQQRIRGASDDVLFIGTSIHKNSDSSMHINGYFFNATPNLLVSVDSMDVTLTLYKDGNEVYENTFHSDHPVQLNGLLSPYEKQGTSFDAHDANGIFPDYDSFFVTSSSAQWTYRTYD